MLRDASSGPMTGSLTFRPAEAGDALSLSRLLAELGYPTEAEEIPERLAALAEFPRALALTAVMGSEVIGLITSHIFPSIHARRPIAWITSLVVAHEHRGKGIGGELVLRAEQWAAAHGAGRVSVTSALHREATHLFYERRDYDRNGLRFTKVLPE